MALNRWTRYVLHFALALPLPVQAALFQDATANKATNPEADLLAILAGTKDGESKLKLQLAPKLSFDASVEGTIGPGFLEPKRQLYNMSMSWALDKMGSLEFVHRLQQGSDINGATLSSVQDQCTLTRNFQSFGKLKYIGLRQDVVGTQAGFSKEQLNYDLNLDKRTSFSSEQARTRFDDGRRETIRTNVISAAVSKSSGFTATDRTVVRNAINSDEHLQRLGFWCDVRPGIRLAYGYNKLQTGLAISPVTGSDQASHSLTLTNAQFLRMGRFASMGLSLQCDAAADQSTWLRQNRVAAFSGRMGSNTLTLTERSQVDTMGERGTDRGIQFATDQSTRRIVAIGANYKVRTMPDDHQVSISDTSFNFRASKSLEISNAKARNPEMVVPTSLMGSIIQDMRADRWKLDFKKSPNVSAAWSYDEVLSNGATSRTTGLTLTFNSAKGSPLSLFYGVETSDPNGERSKTSRYQLRLSQKAGPNQQMSIFAGNVTYDRAFGAGGSQGGFTIDVDYKLKF